MDIKEQIINEIKILLDKLNVEYNKYTIMKDRDYQYFQDKFVNKFGIYKIDHLAKKRPIEALNLYLKEIALEYDSLYSGHIKDVEGPYTVVVRKEGKGFELLVFRVDNSETTTRPLFRNKEDASKALELAREWYHSIVLS